MTPNAEVMLHQPIGGVFGSTDHVMTEWWGGSWSVVRRHRHGPDLAGPPDFAFEIEVKNYARAKLRWILSCPFVLLDWWDRMRAIATKAPMLCVKAEGVWLVLVRRRDLGELRLPATYFSLLSAKGERLVGCRLQDLVTANPRWPDAPRPPERIRLPLWLRRRRARFT